ncbi:hypothetical protein LI020_03705 [[Clostridium] symbiosum]|uniref:hypothetical protein n=1 Tax=Clostridium symbiosum TaxID=1512 RepID=UPI001D0987CA|nr:hypothetical protein [[Clostridium] symbiosum]MCB6607198.1 hypothetical protein [[Clostridium] symbiosum]MCB6929758.1 hypothetical protein [[Clostridium] symbiosum]
MEALTKKNLRLWGAGKALALFAGCLLFSSGGRYTGGIYYEQHILSAVSDHYYLTYFMLPVLLLSCFSFLEDDEETVILRFQSYHAYFLRKWLGTGAGAFSLCAVQSAAVLLSGMGLPMGNRWELPAGATAAELFSVLRQYFSTPVQAFATFTLYQFCGSLIIFGICMWLGHFCGRKWSVRLLLALYLFSAFWIKLPSIQDLPLTGFNHLLILHHNLGSHGRFAVTGFTLLIFVIIIAVTVRFGWKGRISLPQWRISGIGVYYIRELAAGRNLLILSTVVLATALYRGVGLRLTETGPDWIYSLFAGHGTGYFRVFPFLEMMIMVDAPLYLLAFFVEQTVSGQSLFISLRAVSRRKLMRGILSAGTIFLAVYALLWLTASAFTICVFGYGAGEMVWSLLLYAVFMRFLDTMVQYLVMMCIYVFSKQITIGFLALIAGNLLCMIPQPWVSYLPFGLSGLTRIAELNSGVGIPAAAAFGLELSLAILMLVYLLLFGCKKILY